MESAASPLLRTLFLVAALALSLHALELAHGNLSPGTPDSINNLATARNLVAGRGYTSEIVHQYFVPQDVPGPETVRPPGVPYLVALCFWLFGESLAIPVLLNLAFLLGTAAFLRAGLQRLGCRWLAEAAGLLALLTGNFEPHSLWNNNALATATMALFWLGSLRLAGDLSRTRFAALAGALAAAGFFFKPTFVATAIPAALVLILWYPSPEDPPANVWRPRLRDAALLVAAFAVLSSPYWVRNLVLFGDPIYNPMRALRVVARYGFESGLTIWPSGSWRTVRLGHPLTLGELVDAAGLRWVIEREGLVLRHALTTFFLSNPVVVAAGLLGGVRLARRGGSERLALLFCLGLLGESLLSLFYISVAPRYLWPAYFVALAVAALGIPVLERRGSEPGRRWLQGAAALLLLAAVATGSLRAFDRHAAARAMSRWPQGQWAAFVKDRIPEGTVVLSDQPWLVWWYAERPSVMAPTSGLGGVLQVLQLHRPTHFLYLGDATAGRPALGPNELERVAGDPRRRWTLYRLKPHLFDLELPEAIDPPLRIR